MSVKLVRALPHHIPDVARLFDLYRQFYECPADAALAEQFIRDRIGNNESVIFLAQDGDSPAGFVQLYPTFCSVQAVKIFVLYDLYVDKAFRQQGVGEQLMQAASEHAVTSGVQRIDLMTAFSNTPGQRLYEKLGYIKDLAEFHSYSLMLG